MSSIDQLTIAEIMSIVKSILRFSVYDSDYYEQYKNREH